VDAPRAPGRSSSAPKPAPALASASGPSRAGIQLQVAAFAKVVNAEALRDELAGVFEHVHVEETSVAGKTWFRVRVGPFDTSAEAGSAEQRLKEMGHAPVRYGRPKTT
jgi:cell division protein FtsN